MAERFKKEKLSRKALDELAKRNIDSTSARTYTYTTASGEKLPVSTVKILSRKWKKRTNLLTRSNLSIS